MGLTFGQLAETPVGPLSIVAGDNGLQGVAFKLLNELKMSLPHTDQVPSLVGMDTIGTLLVEMNAYLFGLQRDFSVLIDWDVMDGFQREVLSLAIEIPYGQVSTYGAIARALGKPGAARAVGSALGRNPMPIVIPCHRVIGGDFDLHGFIGGERVKTFLLTLEGHKIIDNHVVQ